MRHKDGSYRWIHTRARIFRDEAGKALRMLGCHLDITERKRTEGLYLAKEAAEEANRAKSQFLANMSHELRTPLNAIIGFSEMLQDQIGGKLQPKQARYVDNVLTSGRHLLQLVNDILDLSKVEAGHSHLESLGSTRRRRCAAFRVSCRRLRRKRRSASATNWRASRFFSPRTKPSSSRSCTTCSATPSSSRRMEDGLVFGRLSKPPSCSDCQAGRSDTGCLTVSISDTGIGIKPEDQARIFREFEQVDSTYARRQQGTGLGLALSRKLVELHGGRIWVESEGADGKGSVFSFTLPLEPHSGQMGDTVAYLENAK